MHPRVLIVDDSADVAGDQALIDICAIVQSELRDIDFGARFGGEEFVCITRNFGGSAPIVSERVRNRVAESDFLWKDITFNITASLGVAELEATMQACDERLDDADSALSVAEERRNRVVTKRVSA